MIAAARTCNLILIVLDCLKPITHKKLIEYELEGFGIRLNKEPPEITVKKKDKGGVTFTTTVKDAKLDTEAVTAVMKEYKVRGGDVLRVPVRVASFAACDSVQGLFSLAASVRCTEEARTSRCKQFVNGTVC